MKRLVVLLFLYLYMPLLWGQPATRSLADYVKNIDQFNRLNPQEKVWLHFDNTGYYLGETLWFKAYVVFAAHHEATSLSQVLYVELLTPQGQVVDSRKLRIEGGQCHGEFYLKREYRSGFYEVRAYTRSMLNFGDECLFSRVFPVYNDPRTAGDYALKEMEATDVLRNLRREEDKRGSMNLSFYPEGGHAVVGLRSRVAFKATGDKGQDLDITGTVYNAADEPVADFSTVCQGMGVFEMTPEAGEYKVVAECEGRKQTFPLTGILSAGYVMRVEDADDEALQVCLQKSPALPYDTVAVSVSCRGTIYAMEAVALGADPYLYRLSKVGLPVGCLQFTLFDKRGNILSERLAFRAGAVDCLTVEGTVDKVTYKPLEPAVMEFRVTDPAGAPVSTRFSFALRDAGTELHTGYQGGMLTDLLLSSDVRGHIENPMQYFTSTDHSVRARLDLLMLVQGWRRYDWQLMAGVVPFEAKYYAEEGLDISGKVLDYSKGVALAGVDIMYWMIRDSASFHGRSKTDEDGRFHFSLPDSAHIGGKWQLSLSVTSKGKRKHCRILVDRSGPQGKAYSYSDIAVKDTLIVFEEQTDSLKKSVMEMQYLEEVVVKKEKLKPDIVLDVERDINVFRDKGESYPLTVGEYMQDRVAAMQGNRYAGQKTYYCYRWKRPATPNRFESARIAIPSFNMEDVYRIDIYYRNKFAWNEVVSNGRCLQHAPHEPATFILVFLYDDGLHDGYQKGIRRTFYNGYSKSKTFYHADNSRKLPGEADFRRTLYWNPGVKTDEQGRAKISFYNNSGCKRMSISAEGITEKGVFIVGDNDVKSR